MILSEKECEKLNSKIRKSFKNRINMPSTLPNSITHADFRYKLFNIWDRQLLLHGTNWYARMNGHDICSITATIRLQQLQNAYWSHKSITESKLPFWTYKQNNLSNDILNILKLQGITFQISNHMSLAQPPSGGLIPIEKIMTPTWYNQNRQALKKRQILFIDEILNNNGTRILQ
jgi:hypothetical protein